ncbi:hypothetical protein AB9P05_05400 [Roseivirga sp. BDSF3-8]|uniref:hypothetical protein n=1 Tax=Roseivirga sp. BDSF3-8 TaxID=3241598 RepID=UPI0035318147
MKHRYGKNKVSLSVDYGGLSNETSLNYFDENYVIVNYRNEPYLLGIVRDFDEIILKNYPTIKAVYLTKTKDSVSTANDELSISWLNALPQLKILRIDGFTLENKMYSYFNKLEHLIFEDNSPQNKKILMKNRYNFSSLKYLVVGFELSDSEVKALKTDNPQLTVYTPEEYSLKIEVREIDIFY